nr:MAG: hypothetical protein [Bacteriophage sp.]
MNQNEGGERHLSGKFPKKRQTKAPASEERRLALLKEDL